MIVTYPATPDGQAAAFSIPPPRRITYSPQGILVATGEDVPEATPIEQIAALEAAMPITHRNIRELALSVAQIASFITGVDMKENPAVQEILAFEAKVVAIRAQL